MAPIKMHIYTLELRSPYSYITIEHVRLLKRKLEELDNVTRNRLILLVGPPKSGKTSILKRLYETNVNRFSYCNLGVSLTKRLLELTVQERRLDLIQILRDVIIKYDSETLLIDNIEILFDQQLAIDPLRCLIDISRLGKKIISSWSGFYDDLKDIITYAEISHPEYRHYNAHQIDALIHVIGSGQRP